MIKQLAHYLTAKWLGPAYEFHSHHYMRHNARRLEHLASLQIPVDGRTVLEVGAGIGDLSHFYLDRNSGRRHRAELKHIHSNRGEPRDKRGLDHVAGQPGVLADHDTVAVIAARAPSAA